MSRFQRKPIPEPRNPLASTFGAPDFGVDDAGVRWFYEITPMGSGSGSSTRPGCRSPSPWQNC